MPDAKISSLIELAEAPASTDEFVIVDKSDTTMAVTGTTKKITKQNALGAEIASITALQSVVKPASSANPAYIELKEDTDNGTNKITVTAPSAIASDKTLTLPDATDTLVGKDTTDTLTNKTLGSPILSDTTPVTDGAIGFDRANEDFSIGDGTNAQKIHMGAWKTYTPTWANLTVGNGTVSARYTVVGKTYMSSVKITFGSTTSITGAYPSCTTAITLNANSSHATISYLDAGVARYFGESYGFSSGFGMECKKSNNTYVDSSGVSATVPFTWGTGDSIEIFTIGEIA